ncbi:hypothetical protein CMK12_15235 [Candidatus Poribacteria bacterium]|nr:hypothetical protein [Candidatus Poribacteria bacterium]
MIDQPAGISIDATSIGAIAFGLRNINITRGKREMTSLKSNNLKPKNLKFNLGFYICFITLAHVCSSQEMEVQAPTLSQHFAIKVVDEETNRGVPLIQLETVNHRRYWTDSNGLVAFYEPGLMGQQVFFHVSSHGYEYPPDEFGYRGVKLHVTSGGEAEIGVTRLNLAERLYRITGQGVYRDSLKLGKPVPPHSEPLKAQVLGSDSVVNVVNGDYIYWFWGDTNYARYPLGNFHVPGARSKLPAAGGLSPEQGIDFEYFVDDKGFARETCKMPGKGPTWIDSLMLLGDDQGAQRIFAVYMKVQNWLDIYERGIVEFDVEQKQFQCSVVFPKDQAVIPRGHPFLHQVDGKPYFYFAGAMPRVRVPADVKAIKDPASYESYSFLKPSPGNELPALNRDADGNLIYSWRQDVPRPDREMIQQLAEKGAILAEESPNLLTDIESGKLVTTHHGSVYWNDYRHRWIMITTESAGRSELGEIWYAEAIRPEGPWAYGRRVITHHQYSFYNPKQHPMFDQQNGRVIYLEGTYTKTFSGNDHPTPGYDYNQIMYRLDLSQPDLNLPQPVYRVNAADGGYNWQIGGPLDQVESKLVFFALDRPGADTRSVKLGSTTIHLHISAFSAGECSTVPLWHRETKEGTAWQVGNMDDADDAQLVGYVWPVPLHVAP